jgi:hypothetical protein
MKERVIALWFIKVKKTKILTKTYKKWV